MDYVVARELNSLYIILDILFLLVFGYLLLRHNKRLAFWFGIAGALLYFIVDYGGFYLLLGTRTVDGASTFWFLLWLSTSYGFTNFVWIWLLLERDRNVVRWSALILGGWLVVAMLSQLLGSSFTTINIARNTGGYHWLMAIILIAGYAIMLHRRFVQNITSDPSIFYLFFVGVLVQFSWESALLVSGIRPLGAQPIIFNSLLETNLGIPYLVFIQRAIKQRFMVAPTSDMVLVAE